MTDYSKFEHIIYQFTGISGEPYFKISPHDGKEQPSETWTDGSSFGMRKIFNSDVLLVPDMDTFKEYPFRENVGVVYCDLHDSNGPIDYSPRDLLKRLTSELKGKTGYTYRTGAEMEFFLLPLDEKGDPKFEFSDKSYYFAPEEDIILDIYENAKRALDMFGIKVEAFHHEVSAGQHEISFTFDEALRTADNIQTVKMTLKRLAKNFGLYPTFMPKPFFGVNGSGMHVHQSLANDEGNVFAEGRGLSETALEFIAGQVQHARGLAAAIAPTVNSYKRLVPGYEAPVYSCWSATNRSAMIRIPETRGNPKAARIELRCPDPSSNPYVAFAAMLVTGMDGIEKKLKVDPINDTNIYHLTKAQRHELGIAELPSSLGEAVHEMEKDATIMKAFGEFGPKYLETLAKDAEEYRLAVTDWEREKYYTR